MCVKLRSKSQPAGAAGVPETGPLVVAIGRVERRLGMILDQLPAIVWAVDEHLVFTSALGAGLRAMGHAPNHVVGMSIAEVHRLDESLETVLSAHRAVLGGRPRSYRTVAFGRVLEAHLEPQRNAAGRVVGVVGVAVDVTETDALSAALYESEAALEHAQATAGLGSWRVDLRTQQLLWSRGLGNIFGLPDGEKLTLSTLTRFDHPDDVPAVESARARARLSGKPYKLDRRIIHADGGTRWMEEQGEFRNDDAGEPAVFRGTMHDITERKAAEERLVFAAMHDMLTGLPNRRGLSAGLARMLDAPPGEGTTVALCFVDIAGRSAVNDTLGFPAGDECIVIAAQRLANCTGDGALLARFGDEQFVVALPSVSGQAELVALAERIIQSFARPFVASRNEMYCAVNIGIDCTAGPMTGADALIRNADTAMLQAKSDGRNLFRFFTAQMRDRAADKLALETDLRRAVVNEDLRVYYQPVVTPAGVLAGFEALLRWPHPARGFVSPDVFIPCAEESGLIVALGEWTLRRACSDLRRIGERFPGVRLAVNISTRQLQEPSFEALVHRVLSETQIEPNRLDLELTETVMMADVAAVLPVLERLRAVGVRISLDDFGTGYSSLAYLARLPVDTLKVDKSYVRDIATDPFDGAIVRAIVALAQSLGLQTVAEGVETEAQRAFFEQLGCPLMQGFLFSRAVPIEHVLELPAPPAACEARGRSRVETSLG
jgi:diguanylate cyclase (GGDEF)-like protein/PAS domain S-box-containing protein